MTISELELRVASLERELARLAGKIDPTVSANQNAWIAQIHGTFENDAAYRKAAKAGAEMTLATRATIVMSFFMTLSFMG